MDQTEYRSARHELVKADDTCYDDPHYRDYKELMGKKAPAPILAHTGDGIVEVWPKEEAKAAAKSNGISFRQQTSYRDADSKRAKKKKILTKVCQHATGLILEKLVSKAGIDDRLWKGLATAITERSSIDIQSFVMKRRGLAKVISEVRPALDKWNKADHTVHEYQQIVLETVLCAHWNESWSVSIGKEFKQLAALAKVDLTKIEGELSRKTKSPNKNRKQELDPKRKKSAVTKKGGKAK